MRAGLSKREIAVLMLVAQGWNDKSIAGRLGISVRTVENHVNHLKRKVLDELDDGKNLRVMLANTYWRMVRG